MKDPADTVTGELDALPPPVGPELNSLPAVVTATISIKRAATGKTETFELIGTPLKDDDKCQ